MKIVYISTRDKETEKQDKTIKPHRLNITPHKHIRDLEKKIYFTHLLTYLLHTSHTSH